MGFTIHSGGSPGTLAPGASAVIALRFTPGDAGAQTATLRVISNAPNSPHNIGLSGVGASAALPALSVSEAVMTSGVLGPSLILGGASIGFASTAVGGSSATSLLVSNNGTEALTITAFTLTGEFAVTGVLP